jgi:DNA-binding XRE family transcriptional regulator
MAAKKWSDIRATSQLSPERYARIRREVAEEVLAMNLRALRESAGKTQEDVAGLAEMTQSQLSRLERRDDHLLSTLRRYVGALGGEIEVVAVVNGRRIKLEGV